MDDEEGMWGKPSKFFISDKPILEGTTDLQSVDWKELDLNVEIPQFRPFEAIVEESVDNAKFVADPLSHSITMEITITPKQMRGLRKALRYPKLPRKLKKYVKKTYFEKYPKRVSAMILRFAFAVKNPAKAGKVGLFIGVDVAKENEQEGH